MHHSMTLPDHQARLKTEGVVWLTFSNMVAAFSATLVCNPSESIFAPL
jgi:hypothetical protein